MLARSHLFYRSARAVMLRQNQIKKNFILLPGAWHASWCWRHITPILLKQGHSVITPDLPGHGLDKTPFSDISLKTYVDNISSIVASSQTPITLVGHSMAGVIISQIAENMPNKIDQLIYVAAYIPQNNRSLTQEAKKAKTPGVSTEMIIDEANNVINLRKTERIKELFFNACSKEEADEALQLLQKEPLRPFSDPITISKERFGKVGKLYIECMRDQAVQPEDQKRMYTQANCRVIKIDNADHSPFFSTPRELANALGIELVNTH